MWTVCSIESHINNGRWAYSFRSDIGNGTGNCTNLGTGSISAASEPRPTNAEIAKHIACNVSDSVKYNGVIYTCGTDGNGTDSPNAMIAVGAVVVILGGLYFLKKRKR